TVVAVLVQERHLALPALAGGDRRSGRRDAGLSPARRAPAGGAVDQRAGGTGPGVPGGPVRGADPGLPGAARRQGAVLVRRPPGLPLLCRDPALLDRDGRPCRTGGFLRRPAVALPRRGRPLRRE